MKKLTQRDLQRKIMERLKQSQIDFENWKSKANKTQAATQDQEGVHVDGVEREDDGERDDVPVQTNVKAPMAKEEVTFIDEGGDVAVDTEGNNGASLLHYTVVAIA